MSLRRILAGAGRTGTALIWAALLAILLAPILIATTSPLLAWRQPVYIIAGLAGVVGLSLLIVQALLMAALLPGLRVQQAARWHRRLGIGLTVMITAHVLGLWITSPPDVIDALLLRSPTPFSLWGVVAMWAVVAAALLVSVRRHVPVHTWRLAHTTLAIITVSGTVIHAWLIDGTMGTFSKMLTCIFALAALALAVGVRKSWRSRKT